MNSSSYFNRLTSTVICAKLELEYLMLVRVWGIKIAQTPIKGLVFAYKML